MLDPFWGAGTSSFAAMVAGRDVIRQRLADHWAFVRGEVEPGEEFAYDAEYYDFPVTIRREQSLRFYSVHNVEAIEGGYRAVHEPVVSEKGPIGEN